MADATVEVRSHNFKRQETLERAQLRHLTPVVEEISRRVAASLTAMLHVPVEVVAGEIRQDSWDHFAAEVPEHTFLTSALLAPTGARIVLHVPVPMAMALVELRLGGTGKGEAPDRPLTDIEHRLVDEVARAALADMMVALELILPVHVTATTSVSSVEFLQMPSTGDSWLLIPLTIAPGEELSLESGVWIPGGLALALAAAESLEETSTPEIAPDAATSAQVLFRMLEAPVEVAVQFPDITLSTDELLNLTPGDVVPLHRGQGLPLYLTVEGVRHHDVVPTSRGRRLACTVIESSNQERP